MNHKTQNLNIAGSSDVITPKELQEEIKISDKSTETVIQSREDISNILTKKDPRMIVVVGPCSIHDPKSALEYAHRLAELKEQVKDTLYLVMRVYFEKPRTTVGWKGLINDPYLDGSCDINAGLKLGRRVLSDITHLGLPTATEMLDPFTPQFLSDLVSWAAIGARTTESQTHREMSSGLSMPIGFKNSTNGNLQTAINAMMSAREPHNFLGLTMDGRICAVKTTGNRQQHVILRGGDKPNFDVVSVANAMDMLAKAEMPSLLMVDCSHGNSLKRFEFQEKVFESVVSQRINNNDSLIGVMIESHLNEGNQKMTEDPSDLQYGVSITDACLSWEATSRILLEADKAFKQKLQARS
jgi:3-deoxy-7-phosphoheptulonate synthase